MTMNFCRNCGKPLTPGTRFCMNCGTPIDVQSPQSSSFPVSQPVMQTRSAVRIKPVWIGIAIGLLLILFGIRMPLAMLFGEQTSARVTSVSRRIDRSSDQMEYNFDINYQFLTNGGKTVSGSYTISNVYNQSKLPSEGSVIQVKYVPALTFVNVPVAQDRFGIGSLILIGLGILLIVLGISGKLTVGRSRRW